jgi:hypothetical protein
MEIEEDEEEGPSVSIPAASTSKPAYVPKGLFP